MALFVDTTALEDTYEHILPYVQGAPDQTILYHLRQVCIEWCTRTLCWQSDLDPILTVVDQDAYDIPLPMDAALVKILGWSVDAGEPLEPTTPAIGRKLQLNNMGCDALWTADKISVTVHPMPAVADKEIVLNVALKPTQDATEIPTAIVEQYIQHLAAGTIARIAALPKQPWTDLNLAAMKGAEFENNLTKTASAVSRGNARARVRSVAQFY